MLGLVAAQLKHKVESKALRHGEAVWVDVRLLQFDLLKNDINCLDGWWHRVSIENGRAFEDPNLNRDNRYNIEAMSAFLPVDSFFSHVYLVDLSPSLCDVARQRFQRLGWKNVSVVCQDVRTFRLPEVENVDPRTKISTTTSGADVATMSYSLSMIPGKHNGGFLNKCLKEQY